MTLSPPSQSQILRDALAELGSTDRPGSMDDPTSNSARRAKELWPGIVRELLARHPWNFALRRAALNASGDTPSHGWARAFALPADCVRWLPYAETDGDWQAAEREGDALLSDAEAPLRIRYIAMSDDVTRWPAPFVSAVMFRLAASLAEGVTQSEAIKDRLLDRAERALRDAKRIDGLETGQRRRSAVVARSTILQGRSRPFGWRRG